MIKAFNDFIDERCVGNRRRYGLLFSTDNNKYYYDSGTNKVLKCDELEYGVFDCILSGKKITKDEFVDVSLEEQNRVLSAMTDIIEKEKLLKIGERRTFDTESFRSVLSNSKCEQLVLELTEKCNFRCKYCIYNDSNYNYRGFGQKDMDFITAKAAIDYVLNINENTGSLAFTFYGGEPLIKYELIRECCEYFKSVYLGNDYVFNFTSNLSLITEEMADYFAENSFFITCSLDGDPVSHNQNRVYNNGIGTFDDTIKGLRLLYDRFGDKAKTDLLINMVIEEPYTTEKLERIQAFYDDNKWLGELEIMVSGADHAIDPSFVVKEDYLYDYIGDWTFDKFINGKEDVFSIEYIRRRFGQIYNRCIMDASTDAIPINGCCLPGKRRLFVDTNGDYYLCEKVGCSPAIGNVNIGIDNKIIQEKYIDEYTSKSINSCNSCWAVNLCGICYAVCYDKDGINISKKNNACTFQRFAWKNAFRRYYTLAEADIKLLKKLTGGSNEEKNV